ncbi:unnamed protein product [Nippostrongylus brasiliensis]|uniref:Saposin B-type domain-containing protein n=1 Tax=Nippostrongylus brasiliensis TaxID=27835 RepID=A0A0N4YMA8_NIPBR|nr:unnamed protein product [Nippostrongylus brasiliensis]
MFVFFSTLLVVFLYGRALEEHFKIGKEEKGEGALNSNQVLITDGCSFTYVTRTPAHIETALHPVYAFFEGAKSVQTPTGNVLLSCLECKIAAQDAINFLISNRNKQAASVQQFACHELLPSNFTAGCDDFLSLYLPTVLYMTWEQFTPEGVCTKAKSCNSVSPETGRMLAIRIKEHLGGKARCGSIAPLGRHRAEDHIGVDFDVACRVLSYETETMAERPEFVGMQQFVIDELKRSVCDYTAFLGTTTRVVHG